MDSEPSHNEPLNDPQKKELERLKRIEAILSLNPPSNEEVLRNLHKEKAYLKELLKGYNGPSEQE